MQLNHFQKIYIRNVKTNDRHWLKHFPYRSCENKGCQRRMELYTSQNWVRVVTRSYQLNDDFNLDMQIFQSNIGISRHVTRQLN